MLKKWYNGYHTVSGERLYNPRPVVFALTNNHLGNYWTSAGPYDEIFYYIKHNISAVQNDLAKMIAGEAVPAKVKEYAVTSMNLKTRDEIFSAMVVYGFLSYENGKVSIPNRELMNKFDDMIQKEGLL